MTTNSLLAPASVPPPSYTWSGAIGFLQDQHKAFTIKETEWLLEKQEFQVLFVFGFADSRVAMANLIRVGTDKPLGRRSSSARIDQ